MDVAYRVTQCRDAKDTTRSKRFNEGLHTCKQHKRRVRQASEDIIRAIEHIDHTHAICEVPKTVWF